jgi:hypothetical protein
LKIILIQHIILEYPSASGIELYQNKFYIIGDDSNKILCLNKNLKFDKQVLFYLSLMAYVLQKKTSQILKLVLYTITICCYLALALNF